MQQPKIHISQHNDEVSEKCEFFKKNKYFSELKTDIDKARARYNLGIPDEFSLTWEAIAGKPDINTLLNNQKSQIVSTYHLDSLSYDLQTLRSNIFELQTKTEGLTASKLLEVEKLWSDVARNSRDILALQGGCDTSVITRIVDLELAVSTLNRNYSNINKETIKQEIISEIQIPDINLDNINNQLSSISQTVSNNSTALTQLSGRVSVLEGKVTALEGNSSDLTDIVNRLNALEAQLATDVVTGIRIGSGISTLNVTDSAGNQTVQIYAIHSKAEPVVITNSVTVNTSNSSVASWDNSLHQIVIGNQGAATLTFTYDEWHATLTVNVTASSQPVVETTYYIGYAPASALLGNEIVGHNEFAVKTNSKTIDISGEHIYKYSGCDLNNGQLASGTYLFFCIPQNKSLQMWFEIANGESEQIYYQAYSNGVMLGDIKYNVYYISPASYGGLSYQFKIN